MAKNGGKQGRVIRRHQSNIPIEDFLEWHNQLRTKKRGSGLYALYQGDELRYVGRATQSIRARISSHMHDPQKAFTHFSVFLVTGANTTARERRIVDLEALLLHIMKPVPQWNKQVTQFIGAEKLEVEE